MKTQMFKWPLVLATASLLVLGSCRKEKDEELLIEKEHTQIALSQSKELRSCASPEYLQMQLAEDPGMKTRMDAIESDIQKRMASRSSTSGVITIPVVVHVIYNTPAQNISDAQVLSQIAVLNEDFGRTNSDASNTPSAFQAVAANTGIQFCLAQRDPNGNATNGIIRKATNVASWTSNGTVKMSSQGGDDAWPSDQYLNIWVCNLATYLGYATYPGGNPRGDGVVIRYSAFGNTGTVAAPYDRGRTATHEVGHWLNIYHIWGDQHCGNDLIADCPPQEGPNYGNPVFPSMSSCSGNAPTGDMFMNYMDYSNDASMNMFSQGQSARMNAALSVARASILTSLGGVPPGGVGTGTGSGSGTVTCNVPGVLSSSSLTTNSAALSWSSTGAVSYNVKYKPTYSSSWVNVSSSGTSSFVSGLAASTEYEFQVQSVCSGTSSAYSASAEFITAAPTVTCNTPGGLYSSSVTTNTGILLWAPTGAGSYNVRYKPTYSSSWVNISSYATSVFVSGLTASTAYEFEVQSVCPGGSSAYSASEEFTTSSLSVGCNTPVGLTCYGVGSSLGIVGWASTGALSYNIRYKATSSSNWLTTSTYSTSRGLMGLSAATNYEYQVQSVCSGGSSSYSYSGTFRTAN